MTLRSIFGAGMILLAGWAFSCNPVVTKGAMDSPNAEGGAQKVADTKDDQAALRGLAKIQENDCPSCHALERKSVGPSYTAIAEKYEATDAVVKMLAGRIITGSVGTWGEIPMTAHSELYREDAEQMVNFVFTLKK